MPGEFVTFKKFHGEETARDLIKKLRELQIEFEVEDSNSFIDPSFANSSLNKDISIKLKPRDFYVAEKELENYYRFLTEQVNNNYYLFQFSNEELQEILQKPGEWGDFDYQLARKILKDRSNALNDDGVAALKTTTLSELAIPKSYKKGWLYFGYFFAVMGGLLGIIIGWHLYYSKRTLPNGRMVFTYRETDRQHGKQILILSGIFLPLWIMIQQRFLPFHF
jgi:hypothetical protein